MIVTRLAVDATCDQGAVDGGSPRSRASDRPDTRGACSTRRTPSMPSTTNRPNQVECRRLIRSGHTLGTEKTVHTLPAARDPPDGRLPTTLCRANDSIVRDTAGRAAGGARRLVGDPFGTLRAPDGDSVFCGALPIPRGIRRPCAERLCRSRGCVVLTESSFGRDARLRPASRVPAGRGHP
jgi:hypothetical protein